MPAVLNIVLIALGGAVGALCRYWLSAFIHVAWPVRIPYGTLLINVSGSFALGVLFVLVSERMVLPPAWRPLVMTGFLGAYTTFSTFSLEVFNLYDNGHLLHAAAYLLSSVVLGVSAAALGIAIARHYA